MIPRAVVAGIVLTVLVVAWSVLYFLQTKDPASILWGLRAASYGWLIALAVHVWTRGIPIRIVADERKGP